MTIKKFALLFIAFSLLWPVLPAHAQENPQGWSGDLTWPREYSNEAGAKLTMYQPQVTSWKGADRIEARVAIAFSAPGEDEPSIGAFEIAGDTEVDIETRLVKLSAVEIVKYRFPSLDEEQSNKLLAKLGELMPKEEVIVALDRILASLERAEVQTKAVETKTEPPTIFFSETPAILVMFDGKPIWTKVEDPKKKTKDTDLEFAVNTNWDIFKVPSKGMIYLRNGEAWYKAPRLAGPWQPAEKLPKPIKKLPKDNPNWQAARESLPGSKIKPLDVPAVKVSEVPAELILTTGRPRLEQIEGTDLLAVVNTDSDLFLYGKEGRFYYLVSGRWFRTDDLEGPWQFASHDLPEDFSRIPDDHPMADVRASIPNTAEAQEAVLLAQIPQTAKVDRDELTAEVHYVGEPEFEPIEGTSMAYATNTQNDVIQVGNAYYLCLDGVWFVSSDPNGPWTPTDSVPAEVYTIPPSSPVYNTTYVHVYESSPQYVTYGYTSGYYGVYYSHGCMYYGTGYYYNPYYYYGPYYPYPVYYGYPYSYGYSAYYNSYTGTYGRGAYAYGPYGGIGAGARYNPTTGTYARGAAAYGPYQARGWAEAYNPRTGTYAQTRQGANAYSRWGTTAVTRGNEWARTRSYSDSRGTVAGVQTSRGGRAVGVGTDEGRAALGRSGSGDLYAGKDGNVYRRTENGWEQRQGRGDWSPADTSGAQERLSNSPAAQRARESGAADRVRESGAGDRARASGAGERARQSGAGDRARASGADRSTIDQLNRDRASRARGAQRSGQYGSWRSSGGSRPTRGSYGGAGMRGGGMRGGGRRR